MALSILDRRFRREGFATVISVLLGSALQYSAILIAGLYQYLLGRFPGIHWESDGVRHILMASLDGVFFAAVLMTFWMTTSIWIRMHDWAIRTEQPNELGRDAIVG